jgi:large conductance mechanosensitive channel
LGNIIEPLNLCRKPNPIGLLENFSMQFFKEFKQFAAKGNVLDLAVGIVIGAAFGKIVTSFVNDILMPPLGFLLNGVNFKDLKLVLQDPVLEKGKVISQGVTLNYGNFIQSITDFIIIAFAIFLMIRAINKLQRRKAEEPVPVVITNQEKLLAEIRDILKENKTI